MIYFFFEETGMAPDDWVMQVSITGRDGDNDKGIWDQLAAQEVGWT